MSMFNLGNSVGGLNLISKTEVADFSSTDHVFSEPCTKGIYVTAPSGGGTLVCRVREDSADISVAFPEGNTYWPFQVSAIRTSGTTTTLKVLGGLF